jgi:hypothetical protein
MKKRVMTPLKNLWATPKMKTIKWLTAWGVLLFFTSVVGATTYYVNVANPTPTAPFTNWPTAAVDIQSAIDTATNGDLILVTNGLYNTGGRVVYGTLTNRVVINKAVTVRSVNGPVLTTIQGYQSAVNSGSNNVRCVYMTNNVVLDGFYLTGGATLGAGTDFRQLSGGSVFCESTNANLTNCVLTGNLIPGGGGGIGGGGAYQGILNNCIISNNVLSKYSSEGGGTFKSILNNCLIISNSASWGGGAALSTLNHCTVIGNIAPIFIGTTSGGGGTYMSTANYCLIVGNYGATTGGGDCFGILNNCVLINNMAGGNGSPWTGSGGGSYQEPPNGSYIPMLNNCLVVSNVADGNGGGVCIFNNTGLWPILTNCTIVGNMATNLGGGVYSGILKNCIVYGNYCTYPFNVSVPCSTTG